MLMLVGPIIILILLWIRPEYMFLVFYVFANALLGFLIGDAWRLTWADAPAYAASVGIGIAINLVVGAAFVALFKWLKTRKTGRDKELDKEMERIRADLAARGEPPART